jgi:hypothetical protein
MFVTSSYRFWTLIAFSIAMTGIRMLYRHLDATFPKYMDRFFGPESPWGYASTRSIAHISSTIRM